MTIVIRPAKPEDLNFIRDSWRSSLWKNVVDVAWVDFDTHFEGMEALWKGINDRARYSVAEFKDVPGTILGYAVHLDPQNCLWVYVKAPYRRQGIGTALLQDSKRLGTITRTGRLLAISVNGTFDPYMHLRTT